MVIVTHAQVVTFDTPFPNTDQELTLTFHAAEGNAGLENCNCEVYLHTGVTPVGGSRWQYVQGDWGKDVPRLKMTQVAPNEYTFTFNIPDFYGLPNGVEVEELSFVFRNVDGSRAGRAAGGGDIFVDIFDSNSPLLTRLDTPTQGLLPLSEGEPVRIRGFASKKSAIRIEENGQILAETTADTTVFAYEYIPSGPAGTYRIDFIAQLPGGGVADTSTFQYILIPLPAVENPPAGTQLGLNREDDGSITLMLEAPGKRSVLLFTNWDNYAPDPAQRLLRVSEDGQFFWINLMPPVGEEWLIYQYLIDYSIRVADPYSELVLDPDHDRFIKPEMNDDFPPYPETDNVEGILSFAPVQPAEFPWAVNDFSAPAIEDLFIYELHLRDFLADNSYQVLIDSLDYLERLGVNAIELMPVNEFEGNDSWGYNPSFHMALDKYYGSPEDFKAFVDAAHARGMAVILDIVLNHVFSQSPLAQLYWDANTFQPTPENPWLNIEARHPFNVGYDVNHESPESKRWVSRVIQYWFDEYHIDGYRFDLSKGLTQVDYGNNVGAWSSYDASRVALLKDIGDQIWSNYPDAILILEHFADNREELELSDYGFLLWGNMNFNYNEATMGYNAGDNSNLSGGFYKNRDWQKPHLVTYMESHDEERLMYKNLQFGNSQGSYSVRDLNTALDRIELANTFFWTIPGPKMIWQFGELGYDFSINYCLQNGSINNDCRTGRKPIRWDYFQVPERRDLYNYVSDLAYLKRQFPETFRDDTPESILLGPVKRIALNGPEVTLKAIGNFAVTDQSLNASFPFDGWWYDYVTGDSVNVSGGSYSFTLAPGAYSVWLSQKVDRPNPPDQTTSSRGYIAPLLEQFEVYPNPVSSGADLYLRWSGLDERQFTIQLTNMQGQTVWRQSIDGVLDGTDLTLPSLAGGLYSVQLRRPTGELLGVQKIVIQR